MSKQTCAFCFSAGKKNFNHPLKNTLGEILCQELLQYECPWCHLKGHTTKHCTMTHQDVEQVRRAKWEEAQQKKLEAKSNSWAGLVKKSGSSSVFKKMEEDEKNVKAQQKAIEEKKRADFKKKMEDTFVERMKRKYGIKDDNISVTDPTISPWVVPTLQGRLFGIRVNIPEKKFVPGDFWYIYIYGTKDEKYDTLGVAKRERENEDNIAYFEAYMIEKHWTNWLFCTEGTAEDCLYLVELRYKKRQEYALEEEYVDQQIKRETEENKKRMEEMEIMEEKYSKGEISRKRYLIWLEDNGYNSEDELNEFDAQGEMWANYLDRGHNDFLKWRERSESRARK